MSRPKGGFACLGFAPAKDDRAMDIPSRHVLRRLLMRSHALLRDSERREPIEHRDTGLRIGRTIVQAKQNVAMEVDEAHAPL